MGIGLPTVCGSWATRMTVPEALTTAHHIYVARSKTMTSTRPAQSSKVTTRRRTEHLDEQVGDNGEIVGGETDAGHPSGGNLRFTLRKRTYAPSTAQAIVTFLDGAQAFLTLTVRINRTKQESQFRAVGVGVDVDYRMRWAKVQETGQVAVSGTANGSTLQGVYAIRGSGSTVDLNLEQWLPAATRTKLEALLPALQAGVAYYRQQGMPDFSPTGVTTRAWYNWAGRAVCWGAGAVVGGAACVGASTVTLGAGCAAGLFAGGAGASVCSDWASTW